MYKADEEYGHVQTLRRSHEVCSFLCTMSEPSSPQGNEAFCQLREDTLTNAVTSVLWKFCSSAMPLHREVKQQLEDGQLQRGGGSS